MGNDGLRKERGRQVRAVIIDGVEYSSVTLAAKALGCSTANVVQVIRTGKRDWRYADGGEALVYNRRTGVTERGGLVSPTVDRAPLEPDDPRLW